MMVVVNTLLFFVFAIVVGFGAYKIFKKVDARYPHTRHIPIAGLALCLIMSYIAEKMDINSYMLFDPVFFASIGLKISISQVNNRSQEYHIFNV